MMQWTSNQPQAATLPMSVPGPNSDTSIPTLSSSASSSAADIVRPPRHVGKVPTTEVGSNERGRQLRRPISVACHASRMKSRLHRPHCAAVRLFSRLPSSPARSHGTRRLQSFIGFSVQVAVGQVTSHGRSSSCLTAHRSLDFVSKTIEVFA